MRYAELSFWVGVEEQLHTVTHWHYTRQCGRALDSGSKEIKVFICVSPIMARFHPSPNLCLASLRFPFTTDPPCVAANSCLFLLCEDLKTIRRRSKGKQLAQCVCQCLCVCAHVFVGVGTDVRGAGVQGHRRTNSLTDHLLELRQTQRDTRTKKENREINVGEENLGRNSKLKERRSLSGLNDYLTSIDHIVWSWQHTCMHKHARTHAE